MTRPLMPTVACSVRPSPRLLRACAAFGLSIVRAPSRPATRDHAEDARALLAALTPGQIALVTGPSGSGKSSVLRALNAHARPRSREALRRVLHAAHRTLLDFLPGSTESALTALARAGLADAILLARTPAELSDGERARFALAHALAHAAPGATIVLDEFLSTLDRATARNVALALRRWMDREGAARAVRLVVASAHDDLLDYLAPEVILARELGLARGHLITTTGGD